MKVTVISAPIRKSSHLCQEHASRIESEAARIAAICLASFLTDVDVLAVALYASDPSLCAKYLTLPLDDPRKEAAEKAAELHRSPNLVTQLAQAGYFEHQLNALLAIGHRDPDYGAKLIPVFAFMMEHHQELCLSMSQIDAINRIVAIRDFADGFVLTEQTADTCCAMASPWEWGVA